MNSSPPWMKVVQDEYAVDVWIHYSILLVCIVTSRIADLHLDKRKLLQSNGLFKDMDPTVELSFFW